MLGFERTHEVSNLGRVRKVNYVAHSYPGKVLRINYAPRYPTVCMRNGTKAYSKPVHIMVAEAFIEPRPAGMYINHIDGDRRNALPSNLEYVTSSENIRHAFRTGLAKPSIGERAGSAKLTAADVQAIRTSVEPAKVLAARHGVTDSCVYAVRKRRIWRHVE